MMLYLTIICAITKCETTTPHRYCFITGTLYYIHKNIYFKRYHSLIVIYHEEVFISESE